MSKMLGAYALEPDYDATLAQLGEPPIGVPDELTFAYAWDLAHNKIEAENRAAAKAGKAPAPAKKAPAKKAPAKRAPRKKPPTVADRLNAEFGG